MSTSPPIAIVGMSSLFAGSQDLLGFWRDIVSATDRLTDVPPHAWLIEDYYDPDPSAPDMTYAKRGGYLDPVAFNPMEFGMPPTTIPATDTAQLLALIAAKRVLEDAGKFSDDADLSRTSVILGVASATELVVEMGSRLHHPIWRNALRQAGLPESRVQEIVQLIKDHYQPWQESTFPGLLGNVVAGRIANRLNLGGSNFVTDAACASSISALQAGLHELYLGDSDMVIAGGVDALNDILMYMCFSKTPAFSPTGDCRPFSEEADGTLIGEGVGMLALRRLEDAERDGDEIYAVIRGLGASSDGKGSSVYAPRPEGQAQALRRAYEKADYSPATVELVEAHGTATKAGDAAEARGLTSVFGPENADGRAWCALGSVKSQIGHTKAAAGSAGLIKVALALHHRVLPPTLKVTKPNAQLGLDDGPLYINTEARPWIRGSDHPRRGSVSSFGFGGSNFHVTIEEYTGSGNRPERLRAWADDLVVLSAADRDGLMAQMASASAKVDAGHLLGRIAAEAAEAFDAKAQARVAIVASDAAELGAKLSKAAEALGSGKEGTLPDPDIHFGLGPASVGKVAFVFPGQGSQYVGMGAHAAMTFDGARAVWDAAADMEEFAADRLDRAVFPPPAFTDQERAEQSARVTAMATAQPAIAAVSLGFLHLLRTLGVEADAVAGHSFGELSALAAAGRIDENALLATARKRGELMAEAAASTAGAMIAVPSDAETVAGLIDPSDNVVVANDNAPTEVVLAGSVDAIDAVTDKLKSAGLRTIRLPVASAFHSSIVAGSCEPFHEHLAGVKWSAGSMDVYANKTAGIYPKTAKAGRRLLADQLASPVRFREMIEGMHDAGITHFVEVGPGRVLTKLIGRCLAGRDHVAVSLDDKKADGLRAFWRGIGALAAEGISMNLTALSQGYRTPDAPAEAKPFEIMITGFNYDRPYPPEDGAAGRAAPNPETVEVPAASAPVAPAPPASSPLTQPPAAAVPAQLSPAPAAPTQPAVDPVVATQVHQVTIEAHRRYQELMAESHRSFLNMAAQTLGQAGATPVEANVAQPSMAQPAKPAIPVQSQSVVTPQAAVAATPVAPVTPSVTPTPAQAEAKPAAPAPKPATPAPVAPAVDVTAMALEVVSEKTGYPVEMLDLDMEMEAGLGIDSIKQVEILSELQERLPGLPEIAPSELANLRTLRDVADKLSSGVPASTAAPASTSFPEPVDGPAVATDGADVTALALEVVSEKTGYPVEMLDLDMEMEAGLGIDSIKQVEILSELQERLPGLPEIAPSELANLRTLRDVADKLSGSRGVTQAPPAVPVQEAPAVSEPVTEPTPVEAVLDANTVVDPTKITAFVPTIVAEQSPGFGLAALAGARPVEITNELPELAQALADGLVARGVPATVVESPTTAATGVICLAGLANVPMGPEGALTIHQSAIQAARLVAQHPDPAERLFVTIQSTGGHFGLGGDPGDGAWTGGLSGVVKTAAREWPGASLKALDIADPDHAVDAILDELFFGGPALEVGFDSEGARSIVQIEPLVTDVESKPAIEPGSVVIVSGGARGVTFSSVAKLAEAWQVKLALLGRSKLAEWPEGVPLATDPVQITGALAAAAKARGDTVDFFGMQQRAQSLAASAEVRMSLADLDARGIEAMYLSADVTNLGEVSVALDQVRETWGSVDGIVHGAGVLRDKALVDMTPDRVADVFGPKVGGLSVLLEATKEDPIQMIALFSSIAARAGNAGQAAYSAANEILNKVAANEAARRGDWCRVRSYNWGPWAGGMVDAGLAAHFEKQGIALLGVDAGAQFFVNELELAGAGVERVVLAAPSFPATTQRFMLGGGERDEETIGSSHVADFALRLGEALKPVGTMRTYLEDLVIAMPGQKLATGAHTVDVQPIEAAIPSYRLVFRDGTGDVHHETTVRYSESGADAPPIVPSAGLEPWPFEATAAYETVLGTATDRRAILNLEGVSEEGGMALLRNAASLGWPMKGFPKGFDPAAFEGLLQLAELWTHQKAGAMQRLASMGQMVVHSLEAFPERMRSAFRAQRTEKGTLFDFILATEEGDLVAELREVQFDAHGA